MVRQTGAGGGGVGTGATALVLRVPCSPPGRPGGKMMGACGAFVMVWVRFRAVVMLVLLAGCALTPDQPQEPVAELAGEQAAGGRHARAALYLDAEGPGAGGNVFRFSGLDAARISVVVSSVARQRLWVSGSCDGDGVIEAEQGSVQAQRGFAAGVPFSFELPPQAEAAAVLRPNLAVERCELTVRASAGEGYQLRLEREDLFAPLPLRQLDAARGSCDRPVVSASGDRLAEVMAARASTLSMTCPMPVSASRLLPDGRAAFQARVEALTGARLPDAVLATGDIEGPIDFSRAPELDMIYLSSLHMRADFSGYMLARMLAWHAARGTTVRIVLTDSLHHSIDRQLYEVLAARYPSVQLQMYRAGGPGQAEGGLFDRLHRANHVKVFATLARAPGRSVMMMGGRNLHDGFVFSEPRELGRWPFLRDDASGRRRLVMGSFVAYRDMEIAFSDDSAVRQMAAHLSGFWHRDHDSQALSDPLARMTGPAVQMGEGMMRHFLSVPQTDGRAMEVLYEALIDAAQTRIDMASPFLNLPPRLEAAMERALARGVAIRLVTRTEIPDPAGNWAATLNRLFLERHAGQIEIHAHDPSPGTLHSKLLVVDGRLSVVSSTNLNQRSFWHDTENGVLILDQASTQEVLRQIDALERDGRRQGPEQPISRIRRILLHPPFVRRLF